MGDNGKGQLKVVDGAPIHDCALVLDMDVIRHVEACAVANCFAARASSRFKPRRKNTRSEFAYPCGTVQYYTVL